MARICNANNLAIKVFFMATFTDPNVIDVQNVDFTHFKDRIRLIRTERGLTQSQVAKAVGVATSIYNTWEHGVHTPRFDKYYRLAEFFQVPLDFLISDVDLNKIQLFLRNENIKLIEAVNLDIDADFNRVYDHAYFMPFNIIDDLKAENRTRKLFAYRVSDNEMSKTQGKSINVGDFALVVNCNSVPFMRGKVVLVATEDHPRAMLREFTADQDKIFLTAWNQSVKPMEVDSSTRISIFGYVKMVVTPLVV